MDTFSINTEDIDVAKIMKQIQERVLEKKKAGVYTDEEIREVSELKNQISPQQGGSYGELALHLRRLHHNWEVANSAALITSHRKILGPFIVALKKIGFRIFRFIAHPFVIRQTEFNAASVRFASVLMEELSRLAQENKELKEKQEKLLQEMEELKRKI
jgi:O-antigen chain-terminating methyltransferase